MQRDNRQPPRVGDHVRFRDCSMQASGLIVSEMGDRSDYVTVRWTDFLASTTHRRTALEIDLAVVTKARQ